MSWGTFTSTIFDGWGMIAADLDSNGMLDVLVFNLEYSNSGTGNKVEQFMSSRYPTRQLQNEQSDSINLALFTESNKKTTASVICGLDYSTYNSNTGWPSSIKRWVAGKKGIDAFTGYASYQPQADVHLAINGVIPGSEFADIDGDGDLDMVLATQSQLSGVWNYAAPYSAVMVNDGNGRFTQHTTATTMMGVLGFTDVDGDGDLDAIDGCLRL